MSDVCVQYLINVVEIGAFIGPVVVTLFYTAFSERRQHDNHHTTALPDHLQNNTNTVIHTPEHLQHQTHGSHIFYLPEVCDSGGQRTLSGDVRWVTGIVIHLRKRKQHNHTHQTSRVCVSSSKAQRCLSYLH